MAQFLQPIGYMKRMTRTQRRRVVQQLVESRDIEGLLSWYHREVDVAQRVIALVFNRDDTLRWRAIEALGPLAAEISKEDAGLEKVRNLIRRLFWLMNDESGGIAWHGPEAIAEILFHVPELIGEYGRIVAASIDEDPFGPGAHWAIARLAPSHPEEFDTIKDKLRLNSDDPIERAYGLVALAALDKKRAALEAKSRLDDDGIVETYDRSTGELARTTVGALSREIAAVDSRAA